MELAVGVERGAAVAGAVADVAEVVV